MVISEIQDNMDLTNILDSKILNLTIIQVQGIGIKNMINYYIFSSIIIIHVEIITSLYL